jgi:hypothetical protein
MSVRSQSAATLRRWVAYLMRHDTWLVLSVASALSIAATTYYYKHGLVLAYGDAESHINIAKRVISGLTPGFGQLGGNWLPLHHILMVPFVWNDWLWRTGLGGAIVSMASYVFSCVLIYKLVKLWVGSITAGIAAGAIFGLNSNVLYMQSTPMSELPLIAAMLGSVYYFVKWAMFGRVQFLVLAAFFAFCGSLIRYDAWFLIVAEGVVVLLAAIIQRWGWSRFEGSMIMFATVASLGVVLWVIWNYLIFHQPFYFLTSPYSAKSQQLGFLRRGQLPSYHNMKSALQFYSVTSMLNTGLYVAILAIAGVIISFVRRTVTRTKIIGALALSTLLSPFVFNVLTLYLGISILFVPQLLPSDFGFSIFNVRYGMMMVPAVAIYAGVVFAVLKRQLRIAAGLCVVAGVVVMLFRHQPITLADGMNGLSARRPSPANVFIAEHYDYGYIAFDDYSRSANPVQLGIPMNKIIYVGNHPFWEDVQSEPQKYVRWLVLRHTPDNSDGDSLWQALRYNQNFLRNFHQVYRNGDSYVFQATGNSPREMRLDRQRNTVIFVSANNMYYKGAVG